MRDLAAKREAENGDAPWRVLQARFQQPAALDHLRLGIALSPPVSNPDRRLKDNSPPQAKTLSDARHPSMELP
jgi:hypothetical protein